MRARLCGAPPSVALTKQARARLHAGWTPTHQVGQQGLPAGRCPQERGHRPVRPLSEAPWWGVTDVTALLAFLLLSVRRVVGARFRRLEASFRQLLAFLGALVFVVVR